MEHIEVQRVTDRKSLVDIMMTAGVCKSYYEDGNDSFILVSSDSDYWGLICSLPKAKFLVMYEYAKCGSAIKNALTVYKLPSTHELISAEYASFVQVIADPNNEDDPFEYTSAYLLKGQLDMDGENTAIKLVSMQNPVTTLKHKFLRKRGTFEELSDKVLSLRPTMDILVVGGTVYFLTLAGENLFNMARSYKAVCHQKIEEVEQADIISGIETFKATAETGHNPRRFIRIKLQYCTDTKSQHHTAI